MTKLCIANGEGLLVFEKKNSAWKVYVKLPKNLGHQCIAIDPVKKDRAYCGTFEDGLWLTDDEGDIWKKVRSFPTKAGVTSVTVNPKEKNDGFGAVYAGTEPSMLYRSLDGGETWEKLDEFLSLPSSKSWSFPPKPDTHHVRNITIDPTKPGLIHLAIEAGALIRSFDYGKTWKDRVKTGPFDTHTLVANPNAEGRLYSAAGDGYFESEDYGETWRRIDDGLNETYLYSVAVHPDDPDTILVSASPGPWTAYNTLNAESRIYRRETGRVWNEVKKGLPDADGTTASAIIANPKEMGTFYAANNTGIYVSEDKGASWEALPVPWNNSFRAQNVRTFAGWF